MQIVTPSAKSHERVTGRWLQDLEARTSRDWLVYYVKVYLGSPIPWLIWSFAILVFMSRAACEMAAWLAGFLTLVYIVADQSAKGREFRFFTIGGDIFLGCIALVGVGLALSSDSLDSALTVLGSVRWVLLLYLFAYCWELFPGVNRVFALAVGSATLVAGYGIWQHFTGIDLIDGATLARSPLSETVFFVPRGFSGSTETYATLLAMMAPFPIAAFLLADRRRSPLQRYLALAIGTALLLTILWTYHLGLIAAAVTGILVTLLMHPRQILSLVGSLAAVFITVILVCYGSTDRWFDAIQTSSEVRATQQRAQINSQVEQWKSSPWLGVGSRATTATPGYDPATGNVYFQVLAQSGSIGATLYLLFVLGFLLGTYRLAQEIPESHFWHRVIATGSLASQMVFHAAGLFWSTLDEALAFNLLVLVISAISYMNSHYSRGLVPDDTCL